MTVLKKQIEILPSFYLNDQFGNKISFKYYFDKKKPITGLFNSEYKPILLKVNYRNRPKQKKCNLNSSENLIYEKRFEEVGTFIFSNDQRSGSSNSPDFYHHVPSGFYFKVLGNDDLIEIDRKILESVVTKFSNENVDFNIDMFMNYYDMSSKNLYEIIDQLYRNDLLEMLHKEGYSYLTKTLENSSIGIYKLYELILEINSRNSQLKLIDKCNEITKYSLHAINNMNMLANSNCKDFQKFHVSEHYLRNIGFCIPLPNYDSLLQFDSIIPFPLHEMATQYYFPICLWQDFLNSILNLSMEGEVRTSIEEFNSEIRNHLSGE